MAEKDDQKRRPPSVSDVASRVGGAAVTSSEAGEIAKVARENKADLAQAAGVDPEQVTDKVVNRAAKQAAGEEAKGEQKGMSKTAERLIAQALTGLVPTALSAAIGGADAGAATAELAQADTERLQEQFLAEDQREQAAADKKLDQESRKELIRARGTEERRLELLRQRGRRALADQKLDQDVNLTTKQKLAKLSGEKAKRLDNVKASIKAIRGMGAALGAGQNTFSVIGDNDFTLNRSLFEEALGRMQSGGAITKDEVAKFKRMAPGATDSPEIQQQKLSQMAALMNERLKSLGFEATEFPSLQEQPVLAKSTSQVIFEAGRDILGAGEPEAVAAPQEPRLPSRAEIQQQLQAGNLTREQKIELLQQLKARSGGQ